MLAYSKWLQRALKVQICKKKICTKMGGGGDKKAMKTSKDFFFHQINVFFHLMK